jgi:medium-chain acyl-[acyl-carrier-protein] hydrolase
MRLKLICLPYAGGSAMIYNHWQKYVSPDIEVVSIELAGRGRRVQDPLYTNLQEVIEDVFALVKEEIEDVPYAIFGHSMGCMIAYYVTQKIVSNNLPAPLHLFFSGRGAPHIERKNRKSYHLMDDETFKHELLKLGGTPPEFFEHPELMELFLPLIKNDFRLVESEGVLSEYHPFTFNISVFIGKCENITAEQCTGWKEHTTQLCSIYYCQGGHFFLHKEAENILHIIERTLMHAMAIPTSHIALEASH